MLFYTCVYTNDNVTVRMHIQLCYLGSLVGIPDTILVQGDLRAINLCLVPVGTPDLEKKTFKSNSHKDLS